MKGQANRGLDIRGINYATPSRTIMSQKLYGIAEFHPQELLNYAMRRLDENARREITHRASSLPQVGLWSYVPDLVLSVTNELYQSQPTGIRGLLSSYFQRDKRDCIQNARRTAEIAKQEILEESEIIRRLNPELVYLEGAFDVEDPKLPVENMRHHLLPVIERLGGRRIVWLSVPSGYKERSLELRERWGKSPSDKNLKAEWRKLIEEKDYLWADYIAAIAAKCSGKGLIVTGRNHLVEQNGYRGLTAQLLREMGFEVEILLDMDTIEIGKQLGMPYQNRVSRSQNKISEYNE